MTIELECHTADDDGSIIGWRWMIDADHSVWVGEISRSMFEELSQEHQDAYDNDFGCFYVLYGKSFSVVLGRAPDLYLGKIVGNLLAVAIANDPSLIASILHEAGEEELPASGTPGLKPGDTVVLSGLTGEAARHNGPHKIRLAEEK